MLRDAQPQDPAIVINRAGLLEKLRGFDGCVNACAHGVAAIPAGELQDNMPVLQAQVVQLVNPNTVKQCDPSFVVRSTMRGRVVLQKPHSVNCMQAPYRLASSQFSITCGKNEGGAA